MEVTGRGGEADAAYRLALDLQEKLAVESPATPEYRSDLATSLNALANRLKMASSYDEAKAIRRRALDLQEKLVADSPANPEYRMALSASYENLGNLLRQTGEYEDAVRAHKRAIELGERLTADSPAVPGYRVHLAQVLTNLGITLKYQGQLAEAESAYRRALDVFQKLAADFPTIPDYQSGIGASLSNVAMLMNARDDLNDAGQFLRQAIVYQRAALETNPKSPTYRQFLRNHYFNLSDTLLRQGDHREAAQAVADMLLASFDPASDSGLAVPILLACQQLVARDAKIPQAERQGLADTYLERARELLRVATQASNADPLTQNKLAWILANGSEIALRDPAQAVKLAREATKRAPKRANFWSTLGMAYYRAGDCRAAIDALEKSMHLGKGGGASEWLFLAMARWRLGEKEQARALYDKALAWIEKSELQYDELDSFSTEAATLMGLPDPNSDDEADSTTKK
jgi:tetratricopeptide (TPR) repeat protein